MNNLERKFVSFEVKSVDRAKSEFEGFSAGIGNRDLGNDIIEPGAFDKTISERVGAGRVKLLDQHRSESTRDVWGKVIEAREVPVQDPRPDGPTHRLWTRFKVSQADPNAQVALGKVEDGTLDQLSIGYRPISVEFEADEGEKMDPRRAWMEGRGVRRIKELAWWETSLVIWAMNPEATVLAGSVKSMEQTGNLWGELEALYALREMLHG